MSFDFSQFDNTEFDATATLENQGGGSLLPKMKGCTLQIIDVGEASNDNGWMAASFTIEVKNDGASGQYNGQTTKYNITLQNPNFPDAAQWGLDELKRWHAAVGFSKLGPAENMLMKEFVCDTDIKKGKEGKSDNQKIFNLKRPQGGMGVPQAGGFNPQPQPMQQAQQQAPAFQPQSANMQSQQQAAPQQQGQAMPDFMTQQN